MSDAVAEAVREYIEHQGPAIAPGNIGDIWVERTFDGVKYLRADARASISLDIVREADDELIRFGQELDDDGDAHHVLTLAFQNGPLRYAVLGHDGKWPSVQVIICERLDERSTT
jgi:hypothetical protein